MSPPAGDPGPITAPPGHWQCDVDPTRLRPARDDLSRARLDHQRALRRAGIPRHNPIQVTTDGVIIDGHHAARAAAEEGSLVEVLVSALTVAPKAASILDLPIR